MANEELAKRIESLIEGAVTELEDGPEDRKETVSYLNGLLKIQKDYFNEEDLKQAKRDEARFLEEIKTEQRRREVMAEELKLTKSKTYTEMGCNIANSAVNLGNAVYSGIAHEKDVGMIAAIECNGNISSKSGRSLVNNTFKKI